MRCSVKCSLGVAFCIAVLTACTAARKADAVRRGTAVPLLAVSEDPHIPEVDASSLLSDTLVVKDDDGRDLLFMKAVRDDDGEMVASDVIAPTVVVATFRNVAERQGRIDLRFDIRVPAELTDSKWQLRISPKMYLPGEESMLDAVYITGKNYRAAQLRGYERYARYLDSIVSDTTLFIRMHDLETFLRRNLPGLYAFKSDTSKVTDEKWTSAFGVTGGEAVEHYTDKLRLRQNARRAGRKDEMFRRYVKAPIRKDAIRLDTVLVSDSGEMVYSYVQTISTRPGLRKVEISLDASLYEEDRLVCTLPSDDRISFYVSSLSSFADTRERFLTKVVERSVSDNTSCYIEFAQGRSEIDENLGNNMSEMGRIKSNIRDILSDTVFDLDSVIITAFASPEGREKSNRKLALLRSKAASEFFSSFTRSVRDTLGEFLECPEVGFIAREGGENWRMLSKLVAADSLIGQDDKELYARCLELPDADSREAAIRPMSSFQYVRRSLYPRLRVVRFDFFLHRRGMVKDTIHTTMPDTVYMAGVRALCNREYDLALKYLAPYRDYNTAVAYMSLDRNHSAMAILSEMEPTPQVHYMLAVLYSRFGDDRNSVQHFLNACSADRSYVFRGSLDPEIAALIRKYNLDAYEN